MNAARRQWERQTVARRQSGSADDLEIVIRGGEPSMTDWQTAPDIVLDFWAPWCKPCLALAPLVARWESDERVPVVRINVDQDPAVAHAYGVQSIPTLIRLQRGREVARVTGLRPEAELRRALGLS